MRSARHVLLSFALLAAALGASACDAPGDPGGTVAVSVEPPSAQVVALGTVPFQALVSGAENTGVTWSVVEAGGGNVNASGLYQATATTGVFHVRATSVADPGVSGSATVTVVPQGTGGGPPAIPRLTRSDGYLATSGAAAIHLGAARTQILVAWQVDAGSGGMFGYDVSLHDILDSVPKAYTVETAAAAGGPWTARVTVNTSPRTGPTQNTLVARQHVLDAGGHSYLRMRVTSGETELTRLEVFDASGGTADDFVLFGDSITAFSANVGQPTSISDRIATLTGGAHRPFVQKAGIPYDKWDGSPPPASGQDTSTDASQRLTDYLPLFPGKYVGLAYGTNDSVNNPTEIADYKAAIRQCLDLVLAAGKVPLVATMPWNAQQQKQVERNTYLAEVLAEPAYAGKWLAGPDLYAFFSQAGNRHFITDGDGLHPSDAGEDEWRRLWAEAIVARVYGQ